jgi:SPP1 family predicted phage head-tail adaptor
MKIGKMDKRITLQKNTTVPDGQGGNKSAFVDVVKVWAEFRIPKVKELAITGTVASDLVREISIRRRSDVRRDWQVVYISGTVTKKFEVKHTFDYDINTTVLVCKEVVK